MKKINDRINPIDDLIVSDEWTHVRYKIREALKTCDYEEAGDFFLSRGLPFLGWYRRAIEKRLVNAGFKEEFIKEEIWFKGIIYFVNFEQGRNSSGYRWDLNPPFGFPSQTYTLSDDNYEIWIKPEIEAALLALQSIKQLQELLVKDGMVNIEAVKVYLRSFELFVNLSRAGNLPDMFSHDEKRRESYRRGPGSTSRESGKWAMEKVRKVLEKYGGYSGYKALPYGKKTPVREEIQKAIKAKDIRNVDNIIKNIGAESKGEN